MQQLLKVGIFGIGNMGNVTAAVALPNKIPVLGFNSSEADIDAVKSTAAFEILHPDVEATGAGKDRTRAKDIMKGCLRSIMEQEPFLDFVTELDVVFVVSSTGGGTGSGISPMMAEILRFKYPNKIIIPVGVLPTRGESVGAQRNSIEYLTEIERLNIPYMLFDNDNSGKESTKDIYDQVNNDVVEAVRIIRGDYSNLSKYGMIDTEDMKKLISLPGMIHIHALHGIYAEKMDSDQTIEDLMINSLKENTMVTMDRDKIVKRRGYIANLSEDIQPYFRKEFPKFTEQFGEPVEVFDHYSVNLDDEKMNSVILINSGLSMPENRLKVIQHRIEEVEEALSKKKESSILNSLADKVERYDGTTNRAKGNESALAGLDLDSILDKY